MCQPQTLYVGEFDAVQAELGVDEVYRAPFLLFPYGEEAFTPEQADTEADLKALVAEYRRALPGVSVVWL